MSQVEDPSPAASLNSKDEEAIRAVAEKVDLGELLTKDYLDLEVEVIPKYLTVTYRTLYGSSVFDLEEELADLDDATTGSRYHYTVFRTLASAVQRINGDRFGSNEDLPGKVKALKDKPQQVVEKMFWGYMVAREAVQRWINDPEMMEGAVKKS